jgi:FkbM family methyltransferase
MKIFNKIKRVFELLFIWISTPKVNFMIKMKYFIYLPITVFKLIFLHTRQIYYFKDKLIYDGFSDIFTTLAYPSEIYNRVIKNLKGEEIKQILDVGGNIGQFSITTSSLLNNLPQIHTFEPNKEIFEKLKINTKKYPNIKIYNCGIGKEGMVDLFYTNKNSGKGSIIKDNAVIEGSNSSLIKTKINLINDIKKITKVSYFDLIKIDVEGYEYSVLESLENIKCKYLFIEIATGKRVKNYLHSDLLSLIQRKLGNFDILYQAETNINSECYDCLFRFVDN